jgi:hypothetical protein
MAKQCNPETQSASGSSSMSSPTDSSRNASTSNLSSLVEMARIALELSAQSNRPYGFNVSVPEVR